MERQNSTRFYDRNNVLLQVMPLEDGLRREYFPLAEIPESVQQAFIQAEDKNFYFHPGVSISSVLRAVVQNRKAGHVVSGASTITMQLVRIIYPREKNEEVTLGIKCVEMFRAFRIETKLTKKKILELYLNTVPFGYQVEGIGSASRSFYGVDPAGLSGEQMQKLAFVPRRPSEYAPKKIYSYPLSCPHFVQYVISQYKNENKRIPDSLCLSVDSELCAKAEQSIQQKINEYKEARIHNGSALVINNSTGEIIVWVGNGDFADENGGQIDGVLVKNQPGSSMKPFLYALALERGFAPTAILPDIPQDFGSSKVYVPLNFNNRYNGPIRMRVALASSLNVPAVYLLQRVGVTEYMKQLSKLGFASLDGQRGSTGLSLALGSGEVTLYEMTRAFSVFPRDGMLPELTYLKSEKNCVGTKVYDADTTRIICDMLSDNAARAMGFGHAQVFQTPYPCIFKTGTSNQFQNIIAMGATTKYTAGVWLGNFGGETVVRQTGSSIPAAIVRQLLDSLSKQNGAEQFKQPESFAKQDVCVLSGMAPTKNCPAVTKEYVSIEKVKRLDHTDSEVTELPPCTWHYNENGRVKIRYPSEYQHWSAGRNMSGSSMDRNSELNILYPTDGAIFVYDPTIPPEVQLLRVEAVGGSIPQAELYVDAQPVGSITGRLFWDIPLELGMHTLTVVCGKETTTTHFTVQ